MVYWFVLGMGSTPWRVFRAVESLEVVEVVEVMDVELPPVVLLAVEVQTQVKQGLRG